MATLQSYITDTRRLLHDSTGKYWSDPDLIAYINKARLRTVADTGCNRTLQSLVLSAGLEAYTIGGVTGTIITNGGSGYTNPTIAFVNDPTDTTGGGAAATAVLSNGVIAQINVTATGSGYTAVPTMTITDPTGINATATATVLSIKTMDTMNITVIWGNWRVVLDRWAFTKFQAYARAWTSFTYYPTVCAQFGQSTWYIGPIPAQPYQSEWDTVMYPTDMVDVTASDTDITDIYNSPVPYYAAKWAKFQQQALDESDRFDRMYQQQVQRTLRSVMLRKLPSAYSA